MLSKIYSTDILLSEEFIASLNPSSTNLGREQPAKLYDPNL